MGFSCAWAWAGLVHTVDTAVSLCVHLACCVQKGFPCGHRPPLLLRIFLLLVLQWCLTLEGGLIWISHLGLSVLQTLIPFPLMSCRSLLITIYWQNEAQKRVLICLTQAGSGKPAFHPWLPLELIWTSSSEPSPLRQGVSIMAIATVLGPTRPHTWLLCSHCTETCRADGSI